MIELIVDGVSLLLGVMGSIGGFLWAAEKYRLKVRDRGFRRIFDISETQKVVIVVPTGGRCSDPNQQPLNQKESSQNYTPNIVTTIEDSMAKAAILTALMDKQVKTDIKLHTEISGSDKQENLFLICGPAGNTVTRDVMSRKDINLKYNFHFEGGFWTIVDNKGRQAHPNTDSIEIDYAIIAKVKNPWASHTSKTTIYIATGIEGLGTWGAAYFLSNNYDKVAGYLEGQCKVSGSSTFCGVVSCERTEMGPPIVSIMHMAPI